MSRYSVDTVDSLDIIYTQISDPRQCLVYSRHHRDWVLVGWSHASDRGRAECKVQTEFTFPRAYLLRRPFSLQRWKVVWGSCCHHTCKQCSIIFDNRRYKYPHRNEWFIKSPNYRWTQLVEMCKSDSYILQFYKHRLHVWSPLLLHISIHDEWVLRRSVKSLFRPHITAVWCRQRWRLFVWRPPARTALCWVIALLPNICHLQAQKADGSSLRTSFYHIIFLPSTRQGRVRFTALQARFLSV